MARIEINTFVQAPPDRVFDLARSIDLHTVSTSSSGEKAVRGTTTGLLGLNEEVTWRARHFGVWQELTAKMTLLDRPRHFRDEMLKGAFQSMAHDHYFEPANGGTMMRDLFVFESPLGILGKFANFAFLKSYMKSFLIERNRILKETAESSEWRRYLEDV